METGNKASASLVPHPQTPCHLGLHSTSSLESKKGEIGSTQEVARGQVDTVVMGVKAAPSKGKAPHEKQICPARSPRGGIQLGKQKRVWDRQDDMGGRSLCIHIVPQSAGKDFLPLYHHSVRHRLHSG